MSKHNLLAILFTASIAASAQAPQDKGSDATQSFVSPLGLGTGATLAVTSKGTDVKAAVARQIANSPINFWQVGFSGTTDKNGQAAVYSSRDSDAPGFKAKVGVGWSSFVKLRPVYTGHAADFLLQAWCRDMVTGVDKSLRANRTPPVDQVAIIPADATCRNAVDLEQKALETTPPVNPSGQPDDNAAKTNTLVLKQLDRIADNLTPVNQTTACLALKDAGAFWDLCPDSGKKIKTLSDQQKAYPDINKSVTVSAPSEFQAKLWASWAPTLNSASYRPVTNGVADLSNKQNWTKLLNVGLGDIALYYGPVAFGVEGGYGQTVQIKTQNICNNTTSATYIAQQCDTAMVGMPQPSNSWLLSSVLQVTPLPVLGRGATIVPAAQVQYSYVAPLSGGHSSELALPIYLAPALSPMSFVFGIQPTWDWSTDPKVGNKFFVSLFVGARPTLSKEK
jgi:hypothetical protein